MTSLRKLTLHRLLRLGGSPLRHPLVQKLLYNVSALGLHVQQPDEDVFGTDGTKPIRSIADALRVGSEVHLVIRFMEQQEVLVGVDAHVGYAEGP